MLTKLQDFEEQIRIFLYMVGQVSFLFFFSNNLPTYLKKGLLKIIIKGAKMMHKDLFISASDTKPALVAATLLWCK